MEIDLAGELNRIVSSLGHLGAVKCCRIEKDFDPGLPKVSCDPVQIEQVFRNLIVNAVQAMENSTRRDLKISLRSAVEDGAVEAVVYDSGAGIAPEHMDQIFEPFFTTKSKGKGTGLGLPIVKTIVDRHKGSIEVASEVGRGTRIAIQLPLCSLGQDLPYG